MSDGQLASWIAVIIAGLQLIVGILQLSRRRREKQRRQHTQFKGFGIEWSRRVDTDDREL